MVTNSGFKVLWLTTQSPFISAKWQITVSVGYKLQSPSAWNYLLAVAVGRKKLM